MNKFKRVVAYDIETTGFSPAKAEIIEIAAVLWKPTEAAAFSVWSSLCPPKKSIPKHVTAVTGISAETMRTQPTADLSEALEHFRRLTEAPDTLLISHNGQAFDNPFLAANGVQISPKRCWDTMLQTRADKGGKRLKTWKATQVKAKTYRTKHKINLKAAAEFYKIEKAEGSHRAEADALNCLRIFLKQLKRNKWAIWQQ